MSAPAEQTVHVVVIIPKGEEGVVKPANDRTLYTIIDTLNMPVAMLDSLKPIPCAVSAALGHPLKMARWPCNENKRRNTWANGLSLEADPEHADFGRVTYRKITGGVLMAREDGADLEQQYVRAMLAYLATLRLELREHVRRAVEEAEEKVEEKVEKAREIAGRTLTKDAFREFFKMYMKERVAEGGSGWERVKVDW